MTLFATQEELEEVSDHVNESLAALERRGRSAAWKRAVTAVREIAGGPSGRISAQLVLAGFALGGGDRTDPRAAVLAAGIELMTLFLYVVDDAMDGAVRRRGRPTLHQSLRRASDGEETHLAILIGEILRVRAVERILEAGSQPVLSLVLSQLEATGVAQYRDLVADFPVDQRDLRAVLYDKGGAFGVAIPVAAGALLADPARDPAELLMWGRHVGVAYQVLDDVQDVLARPEELGKDIFVDLTRNRISTVGVLLRRALSGPAWDEIAMLGRGTAPWRRALDRALLDHQIVDHALALAATELDAAASVVLPGDAVGREALSRLVEKLMTETRALGYREVPLAPLLDSPA